MEQYKSEFIRFMVDSKVLKFGEFTLKSGRKSPFFMNAGGYVTGSQLKKLGEYYAKAIHDKYGDDFDVLFGPAYKGIPLQRCDPLICVMGSGKQHLSRPCTDHQGGNGTLKGSTGNGLCTAERVGRHNFPNHSLTACGSNGNFRIHNGHKNHLPAVYAGRL